MEITEHSLALMYFTCFIKRHVSPKDTRCLSCEQRLHFHCVSWRAKSSLCRQLFKSVQKAGGINSKTGFFLFLTGLEHCVSLARVLRSRSELSQFFNSRETRASSPSENVASARRANSARGSVQKVHACSLRFSP